MRTIFNSPHLDHDVIMDKVCDFYCLKWKRFYSGSSEKSSERPYFGSLSFDTIILDGYIDFELELISFFHELGHHLIHQSKMTYYNNSHSWMVGELECWRIGLEVAFVDCQISFSDNAIAWALKQILSYQDIHHNEKEDEAVDGNGEVTPDGIRNWVQMCGGRLTYS